jgi:hypothetical protein
MNTTFWLNNPKILININSISNFYPDSSTSFVEKLNNISRLVIVLSLIGFFITFQTSYIWFGIFTLICIIVIYYYKENKLKEGYEPMVKGNHMVRPLKDFLNKDYYKNNKKNPLGNMLLPEIKYTPERKPAPPAFNPDVYEDINKTTKEAIQEMNPTIKNTSKQLFGNLGDNFEFEQSMWNYYANPNTKIANDQGAFAQYLYGGMISGKESGIARVQDNPRYLPI